MMKSILFLLVLFASVTFAQNDARTKTSSTNYIPQPIYISADQVVIYQDDMNGTNDTTSLKNRGYKVYFRGSGSQGTTATWFQGNGAGVFPAYNGPIDGYVAANYNAVTGLNNIDNWLVFPKLSLLAGDSLYFWQRSPDASTYPDSMRVMYSVSDSVPEGSWIELGRFKTSTAGWQRKGFAVPSNSASGRIAIRYCVVNGGPSGSNSDYVGLDAISISRASGSALNYSGQWCPTGSFPNLPAVAYFVASTWVGDTLYAAIPTTTGTGATTILKYTWGGTWTPGVPLPTPLVGGTLTQCGSKMYYIGGSATGVSTSGTGVYEYSPATGAWTAKASLPVALSAHGAVNWGDSVIYVIGGPYTGSGTNLNVHFYRIATDTWTTLTGSLPSGAGRRSFAYGISGNKIIISGGYNTAYIKSTFVGTIGSDASQLTWAAAPDIPIGYSGLSRPGGAAYGDAFYVVGGEKSSSLGYSDTAWVFQISQNSWLTAIGGKPTGVSNVFGSVTAKPIMDTVRVFTVGGYNVSGKDVFEVLGCGILIIPVELLSFTAAADQNAVMLNWSTATETNNHGFEVERSDAQGVFTKIGFIPGSGTTSEKKYYSFTDQNISRGTYSYRLIQIDLDGSRNTLGTVEVDVTYIPEKFAMYQNYPNPFNPVTTIKYQLPEKSNVHLRVYDILGKEVATLVNTEQIEGVYEVTLDGSKLSSGVYFYTITAGKNTDTKKFVLMK